jgi:hypothetical protein
MSKGYQSDLLVLQRFKLMKDINSQNSTADKIIKSKYIENYHSFNKAKETAPVTPEKENKNVWEQANEIMNTFKDLTKDKFKEALYKIKENSDDAIYDCKTHTCATTALKGEVKKEIDDMAMEGAVCTPKQLLRCKVNKYTDMFGSVLDCSELKTEPSDDDRLITTKKRFCSVLATAEQEPDTKDVLEMLKQYEDNLESHLDNPNHGPQDGRVKLLTVEEMCQASKTGKYTPQTIGSESFNDNFVENYLKKDYTGKKINCGYSFKDCPPEEPPTEPEPKFVKLDGGEDDCESAGHESIKNTQVCKQAVISLALTSRTDDVEVHATDDRWPYNCYLSLDQIDGRGPKAYFNPEGAGKSHKCDKTLGYVCICKRSE